MYSTSMEGGGHLTGYSTQRQEKCSFFFIIKSVLRIDRIGSHAPLTLSRQTKVKFDKASNISSSFQLCTNVVVTPVFHHDDGFCTLPVWSVVGLMVTGGEVMRWVTWASRYGFQQTPLPASQAFYASRSGATVPDTTALPVVVGPPSGCHGNRSTLIG